MKSQLVAVWALSVLASRKSWIFTAAASAPDVKTTSITPWKAAFLLFSVAMLLGSGASAVRGQSALDGFDPNANGIIRAVVVQPDGRILIGGDFTSLSPNGGAAVTRNFIARLNPDGTLDTTFNPNASGEVATIAVQADGKILAGGSFTSIGGQSRFFLARLDATTGAADSFNPSPNSDVTSIVVQTNGMILVGGDFAQDNGTPTIGGATRNSIARLDPTNGLADTFNPNADSTVYAITVQANGDVLAGGNFGNIGGQTRNHLARLDATTGLADSFNPNADGTVYALAVQADGKILAGGTFSGTGSIGGQTRNYIARLDPVTGLADSFNPNANQQVVAIAVQPDGKILAGGNFSGTNSIGGQTRGRLARLDPITGLADSFDPEANLPVLAIAVQQDGKVLAAGNLTSLSADGETAITRNHLARLETDGRVDQTLNLNLSGSEVLAVATQPDGKILIGGNFSNILGVARHNLARLNTDGTLDTTFATANNVVNAIAVRADGNILIGGNFTAVNPNGGVPFVLRNFIARVNTNGTIDTTFNPNADNSVTSIAVQQDGKILAGGMFTNIGGQTRSSIARLDPTTGAADSLALNPSGPVNSISVQSDGNFLVGGIFTNLGGYACDSFALIIATTGLRDTNAFLLFVSPGDLVDVLDSGSSVFCISGNDYYGYMVGGAFVSGSRYVNIELTNGGYAYFGAYESGQVNTIAVQSDQKGLFSGPAFSIQDSYGTTRNHLARVDTSIPYGEIDSYNPNPNNDVYSLAMQADGKFLAAGPFTSIGGQSRNLFARLGNDTAALRNLAATQTAITWTLGGSSPQFARVTFESSTDEVNYAFLGNGAPMGNAWTLAGLNLPTGQNIYVRARGYYRSGYGCGSESITQSVLNAFLPPPPQLSIQLNGKTNVVLSWATNFTGYTLEASTNLTTSVWSVVSPAPSVSGTNNVVTNAISGSARFYRLSQ